jgi:glycosyltransferase involved in cell wall biosynthesis
VKGSIALIANTSWYLYNFRRGLVRALQQEGYAVVAIAPPDEYSQKLTEIGARFLPLPMDNKGTNPIRDLRVALALRQLLGRERPQCVLTFTVKPNVFGSLAARSRHIPAIPNISGLGATFIKRNWVTAVVRMLYRGALRAAPTVFFQNPDDLQLFASGRLVDPLRARLLPGSGVDIQWFAPRARRSGGAFRFLLLGRLLWDKGVGEFVEAAARVKQKFPRCEFVLMGFVGIDNPSAIPVPTIREWQERGLVSYVEPAADVREQLSQAHCVVLPSYREGTPRSLLEACSMAIPVITTDVPGCRQVVADGVTGYLVKVRDAADLADRIEQMVRLPETERAAMGLRGRQKMEREFDERLVIEEYLRAIKEFALSENPSPTD